MNASLGSDIVCPVFLSSLFLSSLCRACDPPMFVVSASTSDATPSSSIKNKMLAAMGPARLNRATVSGDPSIAANRKKSVRRNECAHQHGAPLDYSMVARSHQL